MTRSTTLPATSASGRRVDLVAGLTAAPELGLVVPDADTSRILTATAARALVVPGFGSFSAVDPAACDRAGRTSSLSWSRLGQHTPDETST